METAQTPFEILSAAVDEHPELDDDELAERVLVDQGVSSRSREFLIPLLAELLAHIRRNATRRLEHQAFPRSARREIGDVIDSVEDRKRLLDSSFALGDGRFVRWGEATVDDHRARIAMLDVLRAGLTETITRHEQAITIIEAAGVSCLDEIEVAA